MYNRIRSFKNNEQLYDKVYNQVKDKFSVIAVYLKTSTLNIHNPDDNLPGNPHDSHDDNRIHRTHPQGSAYLETAGWPFPVCGAAWSRSGHRWWPWTTWVTGTRIWHFRLFRPAAWRSTRGWSGSSFWCLSLEWQRCPHAPPLHFLKWGLKTGA